MYFQGFFEVPSQFHSHPSPISSTPSAGRTRCRTDPKRSFPEPLPRMQNAWKSSENATKTERFSFISPHRHLSEQTLKSPTKPYAMRRRYLPCLLVGLNGLAAVLELHRIRGTHDDLRTLFKIEELRIAKARDRNSWESDGKAHENRGRSGKKASSSGDI